jgi:hypothetical protein
MAARYYFAAAFLVVVALPVVACSGEAYNDACSGGEPCDFQPDAGGPCPSADEAQCCPDGGQNCASELMGCRPKAQCKAVMASACISDEQCPGPPDSRCGYGRCEGGKCGLEIHISKAIPNQFPGDCKVNMCSLTGDVEVVTDPSDFPNDANPCTLDTCEGDVPKNIPLPDKSLCPGESTGVCDGGKCKECSDAIYADICPSGYFCDWDQCISMASSCANAEWDDEETGINCGGSVCHPCGPEDECKIATDCTSGVCEDGECAYPSHEDGLKNGDENGIDCGYPGGPPNMCKDGDTCAVPNDCMSKVCYLGLCLAPTCTDAIQNGTETGNDCGGGCVPCQK